MVLLRWQIGDVKITSIEESETSLPPQAMFPDATKASVLQLAKENPWLRPLWVSGDGKIRARIQALVVDTGKHRIVVDTCGGNDKPRKANPMFNQLRTNFLEQMEQAGYHPDTITEVFCTHLHVDHVGWNTKLVDGKWVPTFKNARYLFADKEFNYWKETEYPDGDPIFEDSVKPIVDAGLAHLVPLDHRICEGVYFEATLGHTPGHVTLRIDSKGERALITGDMTHNPLQIAAPTTRFYLDWNPQMARETRVRSYSKWASEGVLVIGTHFPSPTAGRIVDKGGRFEFDAGEAGAKLASEGATRL
ncbi:beta-lactamase [Hyaloraphidium curvatum]|nr:beta-lactamase [Hyaloraphidium curvatum]